MKENVHKESQYIEYQDYSNLFLFLNDKKQMRISPNNKSLPIYEKPFSLFS